VNTHVGKYNVRAGESRWKLKVSGKAKGGIEKNVVHISVSFPELAIQIMIFVVRVWSVQVDQIPSKQTSHQDNAPERGEFPGSDRAHAVGEGLRLLWAAHIVSFVRTR
jgi:hypothetical protein